MAGSQKKLDEIFHFENFKTQNSKSRSMESRRGPYRRALLAEQRHRDVPIAPFTARKNHASKIAGSQKKLDEIFHFENFKTQNSKSERSDEQNDRNFHSHYSSRSLPLKLQPQTSYEAAIDINILVFSCFCCCMNFKLIIFTWTYKNRFAKSY